MQQTCPHCQGSGKIIKDKCRTCYGEGRVRKKQTYNVSIPEGIDHGDRIRLPGKGEAGEQGGSPGDLFIEIHLQDHPVFTREGQDLHCDIPISFATAALGDTIEVPTLHGPVKLKIPSETQTGSLFRLRQKGMPSTRHSRLGDMMCHIVVETPVKLSKKQQEMLRTFGDSVAGHDKHAPKTKAWLKSIQSIFKS